MFASSSESSSSSDSVASSDIQAPQFSLLSSDSSCSADEGTEEERTVLPSQSELHGAEKLTISEPAGLQY